MDVSIVIPTYNRKKFSDLISLNIKLQTYPFIKEIIIADDGEESERLTLDVPYTILYYRVPRMTIGAKRNFLIEKASAHYVANFDTDDFYNPDYLSTSIFNLIRSGKTISGSADMIIMENMRTFKQRCIYLDLLNEATIVCTKKYATEHKYSNSMSTEGKGFVDGCLNEIFETKIEDIMVCLAHDANTVPKTDWLVDKYREKIDMKKYNPHIAVLLKIISR
jgi:glycosyltransferase involved in cell wall biosynthesis